MEKMMKKAIILLLTLLTTTILVACGASSNNNKLSGVYSYTGKTSSDENHDGQLKLYYELDVNNTKSIYRIVAQDKDGETVQYIYGERVTIDSKKQVIKDFKGHEFKYTVSGDSVTVPDLAGNAVNGDTVTLTK